MGGLPLVFVQVGQPLDMSQPFGLAIVAFIGGHEYRVARVRRDRMVQRVKQVVLKVDRHVQCGPVHLRTVRDGYLHAEQISHVRRRRLGYKPGEHGTDLRQPVRRLNEFHASVHDAPEQCHSVVRMGFVQSFR